MPLKDGPLERWIRSEGEKVGKKQYFKNSREKIMHTAGYCRKSTQAKKNKNKKQTNNPSHIANQNKQVNT